ncbi:hypothetical protein G7Y89_g8464 [Cudoniella acicularis]|uniref:C2H2-type domain-containing protein n=1 Tax=Cudoniella acicularis TaxID=354080 RepID=A0A8H4W116_9HELO|nr:hypothetical protein G7Y89_g8464 [Cudoniella acicularis]
MEPSSKKRRLAPKLAEKPLHEQSPQMRYDYKAMPPVQDAAPPPERTDFESFARHLQDAAMLIYAQANRSPYTSVSVLLLRWEDDLTVEPDLMLLQKVFRERFNFRTETWSIPSCPNPSVKLTMQMAQHIEYARSDHLLIVYYAGHSFVGSDHNLYWACNSREDTSRLKWEGVRCLLEDAQSDILLLLDTCAVADAPTAGNHGVKQVIAAYTPDQIARDPGSRSFTYNLVEALTQLGSGRPFSIQRLHEEIISQKHNKFVMQQTPLTNGAGKAAAAHERLPVCFSLTPGTLQSITLSPLGLQPGGSHIGSPMGSPDNEAQVARNNHEAQHGIKVNSNSDLTFEEMRALVCTTFLGEPSQDMASFKQWLHNTPLAASKIAVEGMFHGPPTVLLVSMPIAVWNVVAADRTCAFLGYVNSHNMSTEYQHLVGGISPIGKAATFKELEDGKILLEAREAAASTPVMLRHDTMQQNSIRHQDTIRQDSRTIGTSSTLAQTIYQEPGPSTIPDHKDDVEDSVEMHEAAEQLKALSHVRHVSHDNLTNERNHSHIPSEDSPGLRSNREESASSQDQGDSGAEDHLYNSEYNSPASRPKARRSIQKQGPKQDTRCSLCSHAPFKDSSSLRKHIAAAHTRPFPCAFSFAGYVLLVLRAPLKAKAMNLTEKISLPSIFVECMHLLQSKKAIAKGDSKLQLEWETHVKEMQNSCLVIRRQPPLRSACPKPDCANVFEGAGSWDDWTEHVGRHMEKGEAGRLGVDRLLARWALEEGIIERKEDGEYRLLGTEREGTAGGYYSDGNGGIKKNMDEKGDGDNMLMDS